MCVIYNKYKIYDIGNVQKVRVTMKKLSRELLAEKILKRRKDFGLTQAQVSEQTGINRLMIGRIENQEYTPSIEQLESLAEVLQFDPTELFITQGESKLAKLATQKTYKIAVAGTGYVGLSIATLVAQHHEVVAVDIVPAKVDLINQRKSPIQDDYIEKYLAEKELNLTATLDGKSAYQDADFVVIAAPTNYDSQKNYFDTSAVKSVIEEVLSVNPTTTMIIKSTIPVGYTESVRAKYQTANLLFSPEFLRESKALYDNLYPSRIIVGCDEASRTQAEIFASLLQ